MQKKKKDLTIQDKERILKSIKVIEDIIKEDPEEVTSYQQSKTARSKK